MGTSISDVASRAGVSEATVSRALRGLPSVAAGTRDRVLQAARALDYVASPTASGLAAQRTSLIGVVLPYIDRWYYASMFAAITRRLEATTLDVVPYVLEGPPGVESFLAKLPFRKRVDGLILVDVPLTRANEARLADQEIPIVAIGPRFERFSGVSLENGGGSRTAVDHLLGLGHTRIACIGGDPHEHAGSTAGERIAGYRRALKAAGEPVDEAMIIEGDFSVVGGATAMQTLLDRVDVPTAVFALSDEMAIGAISVLRDVGLHVPEDVSVVGFDDHDFSESLGLTTVRQDVISQGWRAVELLLERLGGRTETVNESSATRLVVRRSTGMSIAKTLA